MPLNRNALMRMRTIDSCLRRRNRLWTIEDLQEACEDALYEYEGISDISIRTIRRDLEMMRSDKLGYNAPIIVVDKKYYTYEDPEYSITRLPLSDRDLDELSSAMDIIRHYGNFSDMEGQEDILARMHDRIQTRQRNKDHRQVIYIETNRRLKGLEFLGKLYEHISRREAISVRYKPFRRAAILMSHLSPYILKEFNNRWFLIAHSSFNDKIMTLALDRIEEVARSYNPYVENTYFDPDRYFGEMVGVTRDLDTPCERVMLRVKAYSAPFVLTKPLHLSQQVVTSHDDGTVDISLDVIVNNELVRLILGFGPEFEVLEPAHLRRRIAAAFASGCDMYNRES